MTKYVFGHLNPDTDSVVSAIVYANFLNKNNTPAKPIVLGDLNNETKFILNKFSFGFPEKIETLPAGSEVVLLDHNEKTQTIFDIENLVITEVIDHHKFNFQTSTPVSIRAEPLGATCSVLAKIFKEKNYSLSKQEAGLLISGIISDTLYFRSPTSTQDDKEILKELNKIAGIENLEEFSLEIFNAKSDLGEKKMSEIVKMDYKEFEFAGEKYGIGVIETTNPSYIFKRKQELIETLAEIKEKDELKGIMVSVIDILNEENKTIVSDNHEAEILRAVFQGQEVEHNVYSLGSVVSRKKQIVPKLEEHFKNGG